MSNNEQDNWAETTWRKIRKPKQVESDNYSGPERRDRERMNSIPAWIAIILTMIGAAAGYGALARDVDQLSSDYIPREVVELQINGLKRDVDNLTADVKDLKDSAKRTEQQNWEILQTLKKMQHEGSSAHTN